MPRRSAADLSVIRPLPTDHRLRPPGDLGDAERVVWQQVVASCAPEHFQASDAPLLVRYCENVVLAKCAAAALSREGAIIGGRPSPWLVVAEKCDRALVALSMRLRVSPQARMRRETTAARGPGVNAYEWMQLRDDGSEEK